MLHIWKYLREVIVIVGICGEIKQRKTTSQIGIPIRIIQWRLNVEKTVFTLCLHTPSQYFDKLLSMRVCGYGDFVQVRPPAFSRKASNTVFISAWSFFIVRRRGDHWWSPSELQHLVVKWDKLGYNCSSRSIHLDRKGVTYE